MSEDDEPRAELPRDPAARAKEKVDEFISHAELAAVFEGCRKFDARIFPTLDAEAARGVQRGMGKLDKSRAPESPILPPASVADAILLLEMPAAGGLTTNDYHIYRRPGEVMVARWLEGEEVEQYYQRLQAHFDAAMSHYREEERSAHGWKQDDESAAYLQALDAVDVKLADRYLRPLILGNKLAVLSTQTADEINISYLCDVIMGVEAAEVVGRGAAPGEDATDSDRAWFFKLFALRGLTPSGERMCYFTFLQKTDDSGW